MKRSMATAGLIGGVIILFGLVGACSDDDDGGGSATVGSPTGQPTTSEPAATLPQGSDPVELDPADFTATIDNPYWPMTPGTRWVYEETDSEGTVQQVEVTVTEETKTIAGIEARVVRDVVTEDGEVVEDTLDWYAQDASGNVWYLGEDTKEYEDGEVVSTEGSWEHGVDGALAGILIPAEPQPGMAYRQEYYEGEAEDNGEVLSVEEFVEVPAGAYRDVLMTKDTNALEPNVLEYKFYARDVGPVMTVQVSGGLASEVLLEVAGAGA
jgi:hypothetical protein